MTNAERRLDDIEDELETVKQLLLSTARYAESANERIDRLSAQQERTQAQLDQLSDRVDSFMSNTQQLFDQQAAILQRLEESQRTNSAALERIDRILDYLLGQSGNGNA